MQASTPLSSVADPVLGDLARGWKVFGGEQIVAAPVLDCDAAIVGTGGGGGVEAELLTAAGRRVISIEVGLLKTSTYFRQIEAEVYPARNQHCARPEDGGQNHQLPAGMICTWLDHREPDQFLLRARNHNAVQEAASSPVRHDRRLHVALVRPGRAALEHRPLGAGAPLEQSAAGAERRAAGRSRRGDHAQREGLLESGILVASAARPTPRSRCW